MLKRAIGSRARSASPTRSSRAGTRDAQDRGETPRQLAVELQEPGGGQVAGKRLVLVHVADPGEGAPLRERASQPEHAAAARVAQTEEDLEQGRLAGPVRAQQREDLARLDPEADPAQGLDRPAGTERCPVGLGDVEELGDGFGMVT